MGKRKRAREVVKLNEWVTKLWLPVMRSQLKESTFDSYRRNMENHVLPRLGDVPLDEITPSPRDNACALRPGPRLCGLLVGKLISILSKTSGCTKSSIIRRRRT